MRRRALQIVVVLGLVGLAFLFRKRPRPLPATPEDAVNAFFDAADRGDDEAYLALLDEALRESLENTRAQVGPDRFRQDLRKSVAGMKGLAVSRSDEAGGDRASPRESRVTLDVDVVFADRTERQRIVVSRKETGWAVTDLGAAKLGVPKIRYGTPVQ